MCFMFCQLCFLSESRKKFYCKYQLTWLKCKNIALKSVQYIWVISFWNTVCAGPFSAHLKSVCTSMLHFYKMCLFLIQRLSNGRHLWELFQNASLPAFSQLQFLWVTLSWMQSTSTEREEPQLTLHFQLGKLATYWWSEY